MRLQTFRRFSWNLKTELKKRENEISETIFDSHYNILGYRCNEIYFTKDQMFSARKIKNQQIPFMLETFIMRIRYLLDVDVEYVDFDSFYPIRSLEQDFDRAGYEAAFCYGDDEEEINKDHVEMFGKNEDDRKQRRIAENLKWELKQKEWDEAHPNAPKIVMLSDLVNDRFGIFDSVEKGNEWLNEKPLPKKQEK